MALFETDFSPHSNHRLSRLTQVGRHFLKQLAEFHNRRKLSASLSKLSDKDLRDICLTRQDVETSCNSPLSNDAAEELRKTAKSRAGNW